MRIRDFSFALVMCLITLVTAYRYGLVRDFVRCSREYSFVVEADGDTLSRMKSDLEDATFQRVEETMIEDGVYRITVKCPPDKVGSLWSLLARRYSK